MISAAAAVVASASAKAAKAAGSDTVCAIAPVASGAGRRLNALNSEAEASPTAGPAADWRAASAKPHGTIGPVPTPIKAKPATLAAKPACALTRAKPAAAIANEPMMMRRSLTRRRIASALKRSAAWQVEKKAAPRPEIAASFGASSRNSSVDHTEAASSAAIETPTTTPSPIKAGAKDNPLRPVAPTPAGGGTIGPSRAIVGEASPGKRERGEKARRPRRGAGGDQTAEDRADRHASRCGGVQPGQDGTAKPALDPSALRVHEDVDHPAEESRGDQSDGHPGLARGVEQRA